MDCGNGFSARERFHHRITKYIEMIFQFTIVTEYTWFYYFLKTYEPLMMISDQHDKLHLSIDPTNKWFNVTKFFAFSWLRNTSRGLLRNFVG